MAALTITRARFPVATSAGHENAKTPDPKEVASGSGPGYVNVDMGASVEADQFFAGFLSANAFTAINAYSQTDLAGTTRTLVGALSIGGAAVRRRHGFLKTAAPSTSRYFSFHVDVGVGVAWSLGIAAIGKSVQPAWGHEWGSGRYIDDRSDVSPLRGGGYGIERGARVPGWQFTTGDLTDAEVKSLWDITAEVGTSAPVVVCEDPALAQPDLNEAIHYGLFDRPEAYERQAPQLNRWSFRVRGWV